MIIESAQRYPVHQLVDRLDRPDELLEHLSTTRCVTRLADHRFTVGADDRRTVDYVAALFNPPNDVWRIDEPAAGPPGRTAAALTVPESEFAALVAETGRRAIGPPAPARLHVEAPAVRYRLAGGLDVVVAESTNEREGPNLVAISERGLVCVAVDRPYGFLALARNLREYGYRRAEAAGWTGLHASAAELGPGRAVLAVGRSAAGKSTLALALAMRPSGGFLANDRVMVRPEQDATAVRLCAMPVPIRLNAGTLGALGLEGAESWRLSRPQPDFRTSDWREFGGSSKLSVLAVEWRERYGTRLVSDALVAAVLLPRASRVPTPTAVRRVETAEALAALAEQCMTPHDDVFVEDWLGARPAEPGPLERQSAEVIDQLAELPAYAVEFGPGSSLRELAAEVDRVVRHAV